MTEKLLLFLSHLLCPSIFQSGAYGTDIVTASNDCSSACQKFTESAIIKVSEIFEPHLWGFQFVIEIAPVNEYCHSFRHTETKTRCVPPLARESRAGGFSVLIIEDLPSAVKLTPPSRGK